jgi:signal transduction histidine kinase
VPPDRPDELPAILGRLRRGERLDHFETVRLRKDGTRLDVSVSVSPIKDASGRIVGAATIARDIGAAKALERQKDEFLALAAHELRGPVTSLRGFARLALRRLERGEGVEREPLRRDLAQVDRQGKRLAALVAELLDHSRLERGTLRLEREPTDLAALVRQAAAAARVAAPRHAIVVDAPESAPALVDPLRLEQVVGNLLDNAIKYGGDPIDVRVERRAAGRLGVSVRDHGPGIPPEQRERIFGRYARGSGPARAGGLGLGLYLAREIVERHGGRLAVEAPPGGGARFSVQLPSGLEGERAGGEPGPGRPPAEPAHPPGYPTPEGEDGQGHRPGRHGVGGTHGERDRPGHPPPSPEPRPRAGACGVHLGLGAGAG